jgi:hypothetical protein
MGYRDDFDALQRRTAALERELAGARTELQSLKGQTPEAAPATGGALVSWQRNNATRLLGAPLRLSWHREYPGIVAEGAYAEIVELARRVVGVPGTIAKLEGLLSWSALAPHGVTLEITSSRNTTRVLLEERFGNWAGGIFGGIGGGVGGGCIMLPIGVGIAVPMLMPLALVSWLGLVYGACRMIYGRRVRRHAGKLQHLAEGLDRVLQEHLREDDAPSKQDAP